MKFSKKDFVLIDLLLCEKLKELRMNIMDIDFLEPFVSSYELLEDKKEFENQFLDYTKIREKIQKMMEE